MFKDLMSFATVRTPIQALGFYIVYLLIGILIGGLFGGIGGIVVNPSQAASALAVGAKWGQLASLPYVLILAVTIVVKKKLGLGYYVLSLTGPLLALFGGAILGLIPVAFITTRQVQQEQPAE